MSYLCAYRSNYRTKGKHVCHLPPLEKAKFGLETICVLPDKCPHLAHAESQASQPTSPPGWMTDTYE